VLNTRLPPHPRETQGQAMAACSALVPCAAAPWDEAPECPSWARRRPWHAARVLGGRAGSRTSRRLAVLAIAGAGAVLQVSSTSGATIPALANTGASLPPGFSTPGPMDYLFETGYIWPVLGFVLALAIFLRGRQRAFAAAAEQGFSLVQTPGSQVVGSAATNLAFDVIDRNHDGVITRQELNSALSGGYVNSAAVPTMGVSQMSAQIGPMSMPPMGYASEVGPQDFRALYQRARHDDYLMEGVASVKSAFNSQLGLEPPSLASRMGVMTARKVLEIERMLVQELEESLTIQMGYLASLFHTWRVEATLLRIGRAYEEQFDKQKGDWETYLTDQKHESDSALTSAAKAAMHARERWHQTITILMEQWTMGDNMGLEHACFQAWMDLAIKQNALRTQRQRVHCVVAAWCEGDNVGCLHVCYKNWHQLATHSKEVKAKLHDHDQAQANWQAFLDEEGEKHSTELDGALKTCSEVRARARKDVVMVLGRWERGERLGTLLVVFQAWHDYARAIRKLRRKSQAVRMAVMQFCEGREHGLLHSCLLNWRGCVKVSGAVHSERKRWEDLLSDERGARDEELQALADEAERKRMAARRTVELAIAKWEMGESAGLRVEILIVWQAYAAKRKTSARRREAVHAGLQKWLEGDERGIGHQCLINWKTLTGHNRLARIHEQQLKTQKLTWEDLLTDERRRHSEQKEEHGTASEKRHAQARAVVEYTLSRWELGDDAGLLYQLLHGWASWARSARKLSKKRQAVHLAVLKALEGDEKAVVHAVMLNWRQWAKHMKLTQFGEARLAEERKRWEAFLENEREAHADNLKETLSATELRRNRAHQATELMLRQWSRGDLNGLCASVLYVWRRMKDQVQTVNWRKQSVHLAVMRFCEGDARGVAHSCFLNWRHWAREKRIYEQEVWERERKITQLEERTRSLLGKEQARLLKYARILGSSDEPMLVLMIIAAWRVHASGIKGMEAQRQLEVALEERQRLHGLAVTKRKHMMVTSIEFLGIKDRHSALLDMFMLWSYHHQHQKQQWAHKVTHNKLVSKYSWYLQMYFFKADQSAVLAACFWELLREARHQRHQREQNEMDVQFTTQRTLLLQFQEERNNLEEQLQTAYKQIDNISETLQKELKTKEELAAELREAYDKLRKQQTMHRTKDVTEVMLQSTFTTTRRSTSSRPDSSHSDGMPHLPASVLNAPGGGAFSLERPLVGKDEED